MIEEVCGPIKPKPNRNFELKMPFWQFPGTFANSSWGFYQFTLIFGQSKLQTWAYFICWNEHISAAIFETGHSAIYREQETACSALWVKELILGYIENCELSSVGVTLAAWWIFVFRHEAQTCYHLQTCFKMFHCENCEFHWAERSGAIAIHYETGSSFWGPWKAWTLVIFGTHVHVSPLSRSVALNTCWKMAPQRPLQNFKHAVSALCLMYESEIWQPHVQHQYIQL